MSVALVGYGASSRLFHVPLIEATPGLSLVAVAAREAEEVRRDLPHVRIEARPQALFLQEEIDLVVICTPNDTHFPLAKAALAAGKHVIIEAPLTLTLSEARLLRSQVMNSDGLLTVFHRRRWDGDFLTLKRVLAEKHLGRTVSLNSCLDTFQPRPGTRWRERLQPGAGLWYHFGPDLLDQACELFGMPRAILLDLAARRDDAAVDDDFLALLDYPECRVTLKASQLVAANTPRFSAHGIRGSFVTFASDALAGLGEGGDGEAPRAALTLWDSETLSLTRRDQPVQKGEHHTFYRQFLEAMRGAGEPPVGLDDALRVMTLLEAGLDSYRQGRWVKLKEGGVDHRRLSHV